jgi:copper(I)-binding protein
MMIGSKFFVVSLNKAGGASAKSRFFYLLAALFFIGLSGCADDTSVPASHSVVIEKPFVRSTAPGQQVTGAFMRLKNETPEDIDLVGVSSAVSGATEIHETSMRDGVMRMHHVGSITVPANGMVELKPGGLHVMLVGLKQTLDDGDFVSIELKFSDGSSQAIEVPVMKAGG